MSSTSSSPTLLGSSPPMALGRKDEEAGLLPIEGFEMLDKTAHANEKAVWLDEDEETIPRPSLRQAFIDYSCILLNVTSTIAIVFINKIVLSDEQLRHCQISIAAYHFFISFVVLYIAGRILKMFPVVFLPVKEVFSVAAFFAGFLILGNLSLTFNSVSFYQLAKILTTPTVVFLNYIILGKTVTVPVLVSIAALCVGVGLITSASVFSNVLGTCIAVAAFTITALYQIWIGKKLTDLKVSPPQLLLNQAPVACGLLLLLCGFVDKVPVVEDLNMRSVHALAVSGFVAALLNVSQFLVIGRTSALTFNVISQLKTLAIVGLSWYHENRALSIMDVIGVVMTLASAYAYATVSKR
ncbi:hypothetical protein LTR67_008674 [Exophiala xenobiotica]